MTTQYGELIQRLNFSSEIYFDMKFNLFQNVSDMPSGKEIKDLSMNFAFK